MSDYVLALSGVVVGVLFVFLLVFVLSFQGCSVAPRSETQCLKNEYWVKCPKGVEIGTDISNLKIKKDKK